ncbi:flagellar basal-body rod protein FlgG [Methyloraptor flagellatus]|jgi:flagellar basal-body rod protein FlgG|uniref:Flagellar basal-body rod protein FlgG n=1 Tax=Methyloraptor flagellatus TaxID=3162530 RepID=A0AAU7XBB6_9HYPH
MKALYIAASGMMAQELNVEVTSNNIANMRTTGFKKQRVDFQDLLYQDMRRVGSQASDSGNVLPTGVQVGSGVRTAATPRIMSQGTLSSTEKETDVAVKGEGMFRILLPDGRTAYTRDGSFELNNSGQLVTADGYSVDPAITVPANAANFTINAQGVVQVTVGNATTPTTIGQIQLARFVNKSGLEAIGNNLFLETGSSGAPQVANPGDEGYGTLLQKQLEAANVNSVTEISDLIAAQRAYEMNSRVIRAADEMMSSTVSPK